MKNVFKQHFRIQFLEIESVNQLFKAFLAKYRSNFILVAKSVGTSGTIDSINMHTPNTKCLNIDRQIIKSNKPNKLKLKSKLQIE